MKISIIGAGAMGGAIAEGLLRCDDLRADDITVCDHNQPVMDHFAQKGTSVTSDNQLAAEGSDIVMVFQRQVEFDLLVPEDGAGGLQHRLMGEAYAELSLM